MYYINSDVVLNDLSNFFDYYDSCFFYLSYNECEKFLILRKRTRCLYFINGEFSKGLKLIKKFKEMGFLYEC